MIFFVVTETLEKYREGRYAEVKILLEDLAGDACLVCHYSRATLEFSAECDPWAVVHSGRGSGYEEDGVLEAAGYRRSILEGDTPQLGICGGHQIIAHFFGCTLGPIRKLDPGEPDYHPDYSPGYFKEKGMWPVERLAEDVLFEGLGNPVRVAESHYWEVKELAPELKLLASTADTRVQAFRHREKPIYGVQFHPERYSEEYPDGRKVLQNFFGMARRLREEA
ncbi:MAG: gamma-glutamyl-gamma-aminobutyrate hydrolase family protein [Planctomycetes bacterium]|nr:gamma-glutamyl-gamma-aminobutyrate hydrolase family protein [Planctomycetota bacterium]